MKDVSIDIETLSLSNNALILSIGAVYFDRFTGVLGPRFHGVVDISDHGLGTVDAPTVNWWMQRSQRARDAVFGPDVERKPLPNVLVDLNHFLGYHDDLPEGETQPNTLWLRGWKDPAWLENAYRLACIAEPYHFRQLMDQRTFVEEFEAFLPARVTERHHALDDAVYQAECVAAAFQRMTATGAILTPPQGVTTDPSRIKECRTVVLDLGYSCGLQTVGESIDQVQLHAQSLYTENERADRLAELHQAFSPGERGHLLVDVLPANRREELDRENGLIVDPVPPSMGSQVVAGWSDAEQQE